MTPPRARLRARLCPGSVRAGTLARLRPRRYPRQAPRPALTRVHAALPSLARPARPARAVSVSLGSGVVPDVRFCAGSVFGGEGKRPFSRLRSSPPSARPSPPSARPSAPGLRRLCRSVCLLCRYRSACPLNAPDISDMRSLRIQGSRRADGVIEFARPCYWCHWLGSGPRPVLCPSPPISAEISCYVETRPPNSYI